MDSVTQLLFGGTIAAAGFRSTLGRRAVAAGGLIGTLPDLDVVGRLFRPEAVTDVWLHHRAISHSFPVALAYGTAIGWMIWRAERLRRVPADTGEDKSRRTAWMWLGALCAVTHPLIDLFTAYGTQLLAPFSAARFAVNAMPIIDPVYTLPLLIVFLFALVTRHKAHAAQRAAQIVLVYIGLYTTMAWGIGRHMEERARDELHALTPVAAARIDAYPVIFQPWWRRIVADLPDEILIGFASPFRDAPIQWQRIPRPETSTPMAAAQATHDGRIFRWFADGRLHWTQKPDAAPDNPGGVLLEARDYRYGLPGDSVLGFWGLRFRADAQGRVLGEPGMLAERPPFSRAGLLEMWQGLHGQ